MAEEKVSELLACPFCGARMKRVTNAFGVEFWKHLAPKCVLTSFAFFTQGEDEKSWNRRPTPVTEDVRHLTADEQAIMHQSLRDSVAVVASPSQPKADGPGEVSVKALEFRPAQHPKRLQAASIVGAYTVLRRGSKYALMLTTGLPADFLGLFDYPEAATAAAQSDYEARILSALVSPSIKRA